MITRHRTVAATAVAAAALLAACSSSTNSGSSSSGGANSNNNSAITIALNVPVSSDPYVAGVIKRGAQLAVDQANQKGVKIASATYTLKLKTYDDAGNPQQAAQNVQSAIHDGAVAIIEDGIAIPASGAQTDAAGVPQIAITDGNAGLLSDKNGNLINSAFGLRIPNNAAADVLATYISGKCQSVAILHDDSDNGRDGSDSITGSLGDSNVTANPTIEVAASSPTMDAQALQIKAANPCAVVVWGADTFIARAIAALHTAGVTAQVYTSQQGESPAVRALDLGITNGVKFVSGRMDSEGDDTDFPKFEKALANDAGVCSLSSQSPPCPTDAGFKNAAGQEIRQPNDIDFFSYDSVNVLIAALQKQGSPQPSQQLLTDMTLVTVKSANGDARGFASQGHEAFAFEDAYVAVINDMQFEPVKDEALSASLPEENEILSQFSTSPLETCGGTPCTS